MKYLLKYLCVGVCVVACLVCSLLVFCLGHHKGKWSEQKPFLKMTRKWEAVLWWQLSNGSSLLVLSGNGQGLLVCQPGVACPSSCPERSLWATGHFWGPFTKVLLQNTLSSAGWGVAVAGCWFGSRSSAVVSVLCILLLKASRTGIVIESLSFKKWLFSWNKAVKFNTFSEITNLKIKVTAGLHLPWFLCGVCYLNSNASDDGFHSSAFVVFVGIYRRSPDVQAKEELWKHIQ